MTTFLMVRKVIRSVGCICEGRRRYSIRAIMYLNILLAGNVPDYQKK